MNECVRGKNRQMRDRRGHEELKFVRERKNITTHACLLKVARVQESNGTWRREDGAYVCTGGEETMQTELQRWRVKKLR